MTPAAQQSLDQWLPVPAVIWAALKVSPLQKMAELWASWPLEVRQRWLALAKVEAVPTSAWTQLEPDQRIAVLKIMRGVRQIYVASDLTHNWSLIARVL